MNKELMHYSPKPIYSIELHNIEWLVPVGDGTEKKLPSCVYANIEAKDMKSLIETEVYRFLEKQFGFPVDSFLPKEIKEVEYGWVGESVIKQFFDEPKDSYETPTGKQKYAIVYDGVNVANEDEKCFIAPNLKTAVDMMHSMVMNFLSTIHHDIPYDIDVSFRYQKKNPTCIINDGEYIWKCIPIPE